ncbi:hypothetical protein JCM8547_003531 [Rhodosporidiobolus lusitaniae]
MSGPAQHAHSATPTPYTNQPAPFAGATFVNNNNTGGAASGPGQYVQGMSGGWGAASGGAGTGAGGLSASSGLPPPWAPPGHGSAPPPSAAPPSLTGPGHRRSLSSSTLGSPAPPRAGSGSVSPRKKRDDENSTRNWSKERLLSVKDVYMARLREVASKGGLRIELLLESTATVPALKTAHLPTHPSQLEKYGPLLPTVPGVVIPQDYLRFFHLWTGWATKVGVPTFPISGMLAALFLIDEVPSLAGRPAAVFVLEQYRKATTPAFESLGTMEKKVELIRTDDLDKEPQLRYWGEGEWKDWMGLAREARTPLGRWKAIQELAPAVPTPAVRPPPVVSDPQPPYQCTTPQIAQPPSYPTPAPPTMSQPSSYAPPTFPQPSSYAPPTFSQPSSRAPPHPQASTQPAYPAPRPAFPPSHPAQHPPTASPSATAQPPRSQNGQPRSKGLVTLQAAQARVAVAVQAQQAAQASKFVLPLHARSASPVHPPTASSSVIYRIPSQPMLGSTAPVARSMPSTSAQPLQPIAPAPVHVPLARPSIPLSDKARGKQRAVEPVEIQPAPVQAALAAGGTSSSGVVGSASAVPKRRGPVPKWLRDPDLPPAEQAEEDAFDRAVASLQAALTANLAARQAVQQRADAARGPAELRPSVPFGDYLPILIPCDFTPSIALGPTLPQTDPLNILRAAPSLPLPPAPLAITSTPLDPLLNPNLSFGLHPAQLHVYPSALHPPRRNPDGSFESFRLAHALRQRYGLEVVAVARAQPGLPPLQEGTDEFERAVNERLVPGARAAMVLQPLELREEWVREPKGRREAREKTRRVLEEYEREKAQEEERVERERLEKKREKEVESEKGKEAEKKKQDETQLAERSGAQSGAEQTEEDEVADELRELGGGAEKAVKRAQPSAPQPRPDSPATPVINLFAASPPPDPVTASTSASTNSPSLASSSSLPRPRRPSLSQNGPAASAPVVPSAGRGANPAAGMKRRPSVGGAPNGNGGSVHPLAKFYASVPEQVRMRALATAAGFKGVPSDGEAQALAAVTSRMSMSPSIGSGKHRSLHSSSNNASPMLGEGMGLSSPRMQHSPLVGSEGLAAKVKERQMAAAAAKQVPPGPATPAPVPKPRPASPPLVPIPFGSAEKSKDASSPEQDADGDVETADVAESSSTSKKQTIKGPAEPVLPTGTTALGVIVELPVAAEITQPSPPVVDSSAAAPASTTSTSARPVVTPAPLASTSTAHSPPPIASPTAIAELSPSTASLPETAPPAPSPSPSRFSLFSAAKSAVEAVATAIGFGGGSPSPSSKAVAAAAGAQPSPTRAVPAQSSPAQASAAAPSPRAPATPVASASSSSSAPLASPSSASPSHTVSTPSSFGATAAGGTSTFKRGPRTCATCGRSDCKGRGGRMWCENSGSATKEKVGGSPLAGPPLTPSSLSNAKGKEEELAEGGAGKKRLSPVPPPRPPLPKQKEVPHPASKLPWAWQKASEPVMPFSRPWKRRKTKG